MPNYYTTTIINKFSASLATARKALKKGETMRAVKISTKNDKMGLVSSVSLLPFITCPARCGNTCGKYCYAARITNIRKQALTSYAHNTALALDDPAIFWAQIDAHIMGVRFFRFHVAGDIINKRYFANMVQVAANNPHCKILAFTKRYEIVNAYIKENGPLPENLKILFSGEENLKPVNPYNLPETTIYNTPEEIQEDWLLCGGNCFECRCRGVGCWQANRGEIIAFKKH